MPGPGLTLECPIPTRPWAVGRRGNRNKRTVNRFSHHAFQVTSFSPGWFQPSSAGAGWVAAGLVLLQPGARGRLLSPLRYLAAYLPPPLSHKLASFAVPEGSLLTWSFPCTAPPHPPSGRFPKGGLSPPSSIQSLPFFPARTSLASHCALRTGKNPPHCLVGRGRLKRGLPHAGSAF